MEREELDQIPWSQLAMDTDNGVDRRWYLVGIAVGVVVVAVLGFRLLVGTGQPTPSDANVFAGPDTTSTVEPPAPSLAPPVEQITEAELIAPEPQALPSDSLEPVAVAEWFVADWYTLDGSDETAAAVRARLPAEFGGIPHDAPSGHATYVEWAAVFDADMATETATVSVAYRRIRTVEGAFIRDPVRAVLVTLEHIDDRWMATGPPVPTDVP